MSCDDFATWKEDNDPDNQVIIYLCCCVILKSFNIKFKNKIKNIEHFLICINKNVIVFYRPKELKNIWKSMVFNALIVNSDML